MFSKSLPFLVALLVLVGLAFGALGLLSSGGEEPGSGLQARPAEPAVELQSVVVAAEPIERGSLVTAAQVTTVKMQAPAPAAALPSPDLAVGRTALAAISDGQLVTRDLVAESPDGRGGLALLVPPGKRAVALRITDEIAVGNFLVAGDRVDVFVRLTPSREGEAAAPTSLTAERRSFAVLQDIEVLSFGEALRVNTEGEAVRAQTVTLAVAAEQANTLNLLAELGSFYLALRHPSDDQRLESEFLSLEDLVRTPEEAEALAAATATAEPAPAQTAGRARPEPHRVVVIRAGVPTIEAVTGTSGAKP